MGDLKLVELYLRGYLCNLHIDNQGPSLTQKYFLQLTTAMLVTYAPIKYNVDIDLFDLNVTASSKAGNMMSHEHIITQGRFTFILI